MSFLNRIFHSNMVECPRCLGKGNVDFEDIKRLKKELFWAPGKCAYCDGMGRVPPERIEKLSVDFEYLTTDLPSLERHKVIEGDEEALQRANAFRELVQSFVAEIEHLYYIENKEPSEIADHLFYENNQPDHAVMEKEEVVEYIEKVIKSKREDLQ